MQPADGVSANHTHIQRKASIETSKIHYQRHLFILNWSAAPEERIFYPVRPKYRANSVEWFFFFLKKRKKELWSAVTKDLDVKSLWYHSCICLFSLKVTPVVGETWGEQQHRRIPRITFVSRNDDNVSGLRPTDELWFVEVWVSFRTCLSAVCVCSLWESKSMATIQRTVNTSCQDGVTC